MNSNEEIVLEKLHTGCFARKCLKCDHFECPHCDGWCDIFVPSADDPDDSEQCCDGHCTYSHDSKNLKDQGFNKIIDDFSERHASRWNGRIVSTGSGETEEGEIILTATALPLSMEERVNFWTDPIEVELKKGKETRICIVSPKVGIFVHYKIKGGEVDPSEMIFSNEKYAPLICGLNILFISTNVNPIVDPMTLCQLILCGGVGKRVISMGLIVPTEHP